MGGLRAHRREDRGFLAHVGRRRPARVHPLFADIGLTGPSSIARGRCDRVADGPVLRQHIREPRPAELDNDRTRRVAGGKRHQTAATTP